MMRYHICITQFWDFKKWAVAQKRSSFKIFLICKIFFGTEFTGQVFICHTPELTSPTKSALKLHLKMAKKGTANLAGMKLKKAKSIKV